MLSHQEKGKNSPKAHKEAFYPVKAPGKYIPLLIKQGGLSGRPLIHRTTDGLGFRFSGKCQDQIIYTTLENVSLGNGISKNNDLITRYFNGFVPN